jgi:hypothetical protein
MAYYSAYMMHLQHSSLAQLFGEDSGRGIDDDGSDMKICGGIRGSFLGGSQVGRG